MRQYQVSFSEAVSRALTFNYCNFNGRSSRSEYWWFCLLNAIITIVFNVLITATQSTVVGILMLLVSLALALPGLGLAVRRLHDIGKSGWWILIGFIPLIGAIILIVWFCRESDPQPNAYGDVPNLM